MRWPQFFDDGLKERASEIAFGRAARSVGDPRRMGVNRVAALCRVRIPSVYVALAMLEFLRALLP
jgi:hypothetical protein